MQDKKDDLAIVPDTNVLASEFWEMIKEQENVYIPRVVLEEIEFNYLIGKMLADNSRSITLIRDGRISMIRLLEIEKEDEKMISGIFRTNAYSWRETGMDRLLDDLELEELRHGHSERYYRLRDEINRIFQERKRRIGEKKKKKGRKQDQDQEKPPEKEFKLIKKAFSKASADVYPKILDLINAGKWTLIGSSGSGFKQIIEETFQQANEELTGRRGENGIGPNDIRVLASALNLAVSGKKVVLLTTDNHLVMTWQMHEQDVLAKVGKRIYFRVHRLRFKNRN